MQVQPKPPRRVRVERGIYRSPATGRLEIQYTDSTGRSRWRTVGGDLSQARMARAQAQLGLARPGSSRGSPAVFADIGEEWLAAQTHLRPRTRELYERALDRHLFPRIGTRRISTIDEHTIAQIISELHAQGLSGWTIRGILVPLGRVLNHAARRKLIPDNPMCRLERAERPRVGLREMRILRPDEIDGLLRAAAPTYRPLLATAVFTGLRQSELIGLRWQDVDFEPRLIHVRRQFDRGRNYAEPKTPRSVRSVVLMPSLSMLLQAHKAASLHSDPMDPVFATSTGEPQHHRNVTRRGLAVAVVAAGLDRAGEPRLRFHDLRHTYASLLIAQGMNIVFVSRQLGHSSARFTLDVYAGLFDRAEHGRRASEGLEANFGRLLAPGRHDSSSVCAASAAHRPARPPGADR